MSIQQSQLSYNKYTNKEFQYRNLPGSFSNRPPLSNLHNILNTTDTITVYLLFKLLKIYNKNKVLTYIVKG